MAARTDRVIWAESERKDSGLFLAMLKKLLRAYPKKRKIHSSRRTRAWLAEHGERIRLHFLPPYCPDNNRIERCVWRELHQNVTYNHACEDLDELMDEVIDWLRRRNRRCRKAA
jgi:transposase